MEENESFIFGLATGIITTTLTFVVIAVLKNHKEAEEKSNFGLQGIELQNLSVKK